MQSNLFKKLVSLTLAVCLFLGSCPVSTLADALNTKVSASPMADDVEKQNPQTPVDFYVASAPRMNAVSISDDISNGTVTASPKSAAEGKVVTLTVTPDQYYELDTLTVKVRKTGAEVATTQAEDGTYTFKMPDGDVKVAATFSEKTYNTEIDDIDMAHGWVSANPDTAKANDTVTLTITPDDGYAVDTLTVTDTNGNTVTTTKVEKNKYTFAMPAGGATVSATFAKPTFTVKMYTSTQQQTVDAGTTFSAWVWDNPDYNTASYWSVTRADGTSQRANVDSLGEIENGDVYELIAAMNLGSTVVLEVYGPCDVDELTFAEWCSGFEFFSGSLTVHHTVDGEEKDFVLTNNKYRLADFANGAKWSVDGEAANMNYSVPLTKTAFTTQPGTITLPIDLVGGKVEADKSTAKQGEDVTLTITADEHYALTTLTLNGGENVAANVTEGEYTFTMPANDVTIAATFQLEDGYHTITMNADPAGSAYVVGGKAVEKEGETVYIAAAEGYRLPDAITVRDGNRQNVPVGWDNGQCYFTMPDSNVTITLKPDRIYSVTVDTPVGGTVEPIKNTYKEGDTVKVVVEANNGYQVLSVTATAEDGTTITASQSPTSEISYIFTMPASNVTIKAEFGQRHAVNIPGFDNGRVYISTPDYYKGETVTLNVRAKTGYKLTALTVTDADGNDVPLTTVTDNITYTFAMPDSEATVSATFEAITYTITLNANPEGSAYVKDGKTSATINDTIVIVAAKGYELKTVKMGGLAEVVWGKTDTGAHDYTWAYFTMPGDDVVVTVNARRVYTVTVAPTTNGTMTVDKPTVREDENRKVYVQGTPDEGYRLNSITVTDENGNTVPHSYVSTNKYAFDMPDSDVSITGEFVRVYNVTVGKTANGTIMREPKTAAEGELVNVAVRADNGYELEKLTVDGEDVTANVAMGYYAFSMPAHDVNITVTFKLSDGYHHISVAPVTGGTLTVIDGDGVPVDVAKSGTQLYVAVSSDEAYLLDGNVTCTADGTTTDLEANLSGTYMFTMPDADVTIGAKFISVYKVSIPEALSAYVSIPDGKPTKYAAGETVQLQVTEVAGKVITALGVDVLAPEMDPVTCEPNSGLLTFTMPNANVEVYGNVVDAYHITLVEDGIPEGCTVSLSANKDWLGRYYAAAKEKVYVLGTAEGYRVQWSFGDGSGAGNLGAAFTMRSADVTVTFKFTRMYNVTISEAEHGKVTTNSASTCPAKWEITFTITPDDGYRLKKLTVDGADCTQDVNSYNNYVYTMPDHDVTVTAEFVRVYKVTIDESSTPYAALPAGAAAQYEAGETVTLDITEVSGKVLAYMNAEYKEGGFFKTAAYTCDAENSTVSFTMPSADVEIQIITLPGYYITLETVGGDETCEVELNCVISLINGKYYRTQGQIVQSSALTCPGYGCEWTATAAGGTTVASGEGDIAFNMPQADVIVTVAFHKLYDITVGESTNGTVAADKTQSIAGKQVSLTVTPDYGYELDTLFVNSENVAANVAEGAYTFTMPESNVTISATFKLKEGYHTITLNVTPEGTAFVSDGKHVAKKGDAVSIGATANYRLVSKTVTDQNGDSVNYGGSVYWLNFNMPDSDVTVTLTTERVYNVSVADVTGGTVNLMLDKVAEGKTAYVTVKPDENYRLAQVTATDADGNELPVQETRFPIGVAYCVTMPASDVTFTVVFKREYQVNIAAELAHYVTLKSEENSFIEGETVTLQVGEWQNELFSELSVDVEDAVFEPLTSTITFTMPDRDVTVQGKVVIGYFIGINKVGGDISCQVDTSLIPTEVLHQRKYALAGDEVKADITCPGYVCEWKAVLTGGTMYASGTGAISFTMPESNVTITVTFTKMYNVTVSETANGTVAVDQPLVKADETVTITVTPDEDCVVQSVTVTGEHGPVTVDSGENNTYQFTMPAENVTVEVVIQRRYTVSIAGNGAAYCSTLDGQTQYAEGATVQVNIDLPAGKVLYSLLVIDSTNQALVPATLEDDALTFTMPAGNVGISVEVKDGYYVTINMEGAGENEGCSYMENENVFNLWYGQQYGAAAGSEVTLVAFPGAGYGYTVNVTRADGGEVAHLPLNGGVDVRFTMPESDVTITITFFPVYKVTIADDIADYFTIKDDEDEFAEDETVTISLHIPEGKVLQTLNIVKDETLEELPFTKNGSKLTFTMPAADVSLYARVADGYYINVVTENAPDDDDWLLTPNPNVQQEQGTMNYFAAAAEEVAFAAVCPYGYGCTVSVTSEDDDDITYLSVDDEWDVRFIMPESDVTITITFMQGYKVYLTDSDKAYFTILGEKTRFPEGETVQIKMDIPAGKVLEYLTIDTDDGVESISFTDENGLLTFTMPGQDVIVSTQLLDGYYIFGVLEGTYDEGCNYQTNTQGSTYYSCDIAEPGEQVEMTISCTYGYDYTVSVTRADGGEVEYLPLPDGSDLCFTMPECNVTVTIKYELTPPSYIISIPASVSMNDDEPLRIIAYSVEHLRGQTITVNATSANGNKLVSGDYSIDYTLDTTTLTFAEDDAQEIGLILGDKTNKPAGTYTDTLNFTVSLTTPPESDDQEE